MTDKLRQGPRVPNSGIASVIPRSRPVLGMNATQTISRQGSDDDLLKRDHPLVVGLSIKSGTVDELGKLSIPDAEWNAAAKNITLCESIKEAAVLSTCNRFELYVVGSDDTAMVRDVSAFLQERSGLSNEVLGPNLFVKTGSDAFQHLLEVAAGLDSLVLGEGQILSQVKNMYARAISQESSTEPAGSAGTVLKRMLKDAVEAGKMVRSETNISRGSVSVSSAAVELAALKVQTDLGGPLKKQRITVLGAGVMSKLLLTHLFASSDIRKVTLVSRTQARAEELAAEYPHVDIDIRLTDRLWPTLAETDVVFSAVSASDLITKEKLQELKRSSPIMLVDISVPRSIAADCSDVAGVVSYDVGDLEEVVVANRAQRAKEVVRAKTILDSIRNRFVDWVCSLDYIQSIGSFRDRFEAVRKETCELAFQAGPLADLSEKQRGVVEGLTREITNKLLNLPTQYMRSKSPRGKLTVQQLEDIFRFDRAAEAVLKIDAKAKEGVMSLDTRAKKDLLLLEGLVRGADDSPSQDVVDQLRALYELREVNNRKNWETTLREQFAPADALARQAVLYLDMKAQEGFRKLDQRVKQAIYRLEAAALGTEKSRLRKCIEFVESERKRSVQFARKLDTVQRIMRITEALRAEVMDKGLKKGLAPFSEEQQAAVLELSYVLVAKFIGPIMAYEKASKDSGSTQSDDITAQLEEVFPSSSRGRRF